LKNLKLIADIIRDYQTDPGKNLKLIVNRKLNTIPKQDRQEVTFIVFGIFRHFMLLNHIISIHLKKKNTIPPFTKALLTIGCFLILFSRHYPDYAIVNEIVNYCPLPLKGLTNALLRKFVSHKNTIHNYIDNLADLSIKYSLHPFLSQSIQSIFSDSISVMKYLHSDPVFHLRINPKVTTIDFISDYFLTHQIEYIIHREFSAFELKHITEPVFSLIKQGKGIIQNISSQFVSMVTAYYAKICVLDCCAAPGTKTLTCKFINPNLKIIANDIRYSRIHLLTNSPLFSFFQPIIPINSDLVNLSFKFDAIDFILLDAPCTSSGTLRKNPDLKSKISIEECQKNHYLQLSMLNSLLNTLSPSSFVLYSVCSFLELETDKVMQKVSSVFQIKHISLDFLLSQYNLSFKKTEFGYLILPNTILNNDIFYISLFMKL
jgi:16S rRNA (cytosine967-C5)-methyltransferase